MEKRENMNWVGYKMEVRERLRRFALEIIALPDKMPDTPHARVINYQLVKSGTSVYANYRAALRGRSKAEFFSKLSISVEEADETEIWPDLILNFGIFAPASIKSIHAESPGLVKILSSMRKIISKHESQSIYHQSPSI